MSCIMGNVGSRVIGTKSDAMSASGALILTTRFKICLLSVLVLYECYLILMILIHNYFYIHQERESIFVKVTSV